MKRFNIMKKTLLVMLVVLVAFFDLAEAEHVKFEQALTDMSIEELYELEDFVVLALKEVFIMQSTESPEGEIIGTYVINPKTGKFHFPYCYSALQIGEGRFFEICAPSVLVKEGLSPCGQCKPYTEGQK